MRTIGTICRQENPPSSTSAVTAAGPAASAEARSPASNSLNAAASVKWSSLKTDMTSGAPSARSPVAVDGLTFEPLATRSVAVARRSPNRLAATGLPCAMAERKSAIGNAVWSLWSLVKRVVAPSSAPA